MNCAQAIDALLEADLAELMSGADTTLSRHLDGCERCRARASRVLEQQRELADVLSERRSRVPVERAIAVARRRGRTQRRIRSLRWMAPLAAAAGIMGIVLMQKDGASLNFESPLDAETPVAFDLTIAPEQNVAVFESTTRPNVVVVWFY